MRPAVTLKGKYGERITSRLISYSVCPLFLTICQKVIHSSIVILPLPSKSTDSNRALVFSFPKLDFLCAAVQQRYLISARLRTIIRGSLKAEKKKKCIPKLYRFLFVDGIRFVHVDHFKNLHTFLSQLLTETLDPEIGREKNGGGREGIVKIRSRQERNLPAATCAKRGRFPTHKEMSCAEVLNVAHTWGLASSIQRAGQGSSTYQLLFGACTTHCRKSIFLLRWGVLTKKKYNREIVKQAIALKYRKSSRHSCSC